MRALEYWKNDTRKANRKRFNPFVPNEGVGIKINDPDNAIRNGFQSFCAEWGRWNWRHWNTNQNFLYGFNPFVPNEGVGIPVICCSYVFSIKFQSFCAEWGRWNTYGIRIIQQGQRVSILLCRMRALEYTMIVEIPVRKHGFNPFVPNEGVGIGTEALGTAVKNSFQSFCAEWGRWNSTW